MKERRSLPYFNIKQKNKKRKQKQKNNGEIKESEKFDLK